MANSDIINIDFQIITAGDPKLLIVVDTSIWGLIEGKPAIIEITIPNSENIVVHNFGKSKSNVFNSSNLLLTPIGAPLQDLPDGIYKIVVKGSPSNLYCKERDYLKTDCVMLGLDKLYINQGFEDDDETKAERRAILEIESMIKTAEAYVRQGKSPQGIKMFKRASNQIIRYVECENC